jgi:chemotaxis protein CheC
MSNDMPPKNGNPQSLSALEIDALQEIMNISFGSAAADLSDIIDLFIQLNVPEIRILQVSRLTEYIKHETRDFDLCSIVEQKYSGDFHGLAFLIFPFGVERELLSYFEKADIKAIESDDQLNLEKKDLMEIGNILIGACISRVFELLRSNATFFPPKTIVGDKFQKLFLKNHFRDTDIAMTMKTSFSFRDRNVSGYLFLVNSQDSIAHLKKALAEFLAQKS